MQERVPSPVDIEVEPKAQEVVVIDGHGVLCNHPAKFNGTAALGVIDGAAALGVIDGAARDGLDLGNTRCAYVDFDGAVLAKYPVEHIVVASNGRNGPQDQVGPPPNLGLAGLRFRVPPCYVTCEPLEEADGSFPRVRDAVIVGEVCVEEPGVGGTIQLRLQLDGQFPDPVLARVHVGLEVPAGVGIHVRDE